MDEHFRTAPLAENLPVLMGLLGVWYTDFFDAQTVAVLPYDQYLERFPAYLQQLTMESNGKSVADRLGARRRRHRPGVLGRARDERAAQLLPADPPGDAADPVRPDLLRVQPQSRSGATTTCSSRTCSRRPRRSRSGRRRRRSPPRGRPQWLVPHRTFAGNRPSNVLMAERLTPEVLGALVALYEHSVFTQGVVWSINSFDQWGVELGKAAGPADRAGARGGRGAGARPRPLDERADPALPRACGG